MNAPQTAMASDKVNLADQRLGARALACSDDRFAEMGELVRHAEPTFTPHDFDARGQVYSGWESSRSYKRRPEHTHDWCIIRLGAAGVVHLVDIDTSFFRGNYPTLASLEGANVPEDGDPLGSGVRWDRILPRSPLRGHAHNVFAIKSPSVFTHVRLNIFPDGGVARLRVFGDVYNDPALLRGREIDLASVTYGGRGVVANDSFYSSCTNLVMPGRAVDPADGWETSRRRGPGNHWAVVKLGIPGTPSRIVVDTAHFKFNAPESCSIEGIHAPDAEVDLLTIEDLSWRPVLERSKIAPDAESEFGKAALRSSGPLTHLLLNIYPDGGVSRLRVFGTVE